MNRLSAVSNKKTGKTGTFPRFPGRWHKEVLHFKKMSFWKSTASLGCMRTLPRMSSAVYDISKETHRSRSDMKFTQKMVDGRKPNQQPGRKMTPVYLRSTEKGGK